MLHRIHRRGCLFVVNGEVIQDFVGKDKDIILALLLIAREDSIGINEILKKYCPDKKDIEYVNVIPYDYGSAPLTRSVTHLMHYHCTETGFVRVLQQFDDPVEFSVIGGTGYSKLLHWTLADLKKDGDMYA